MGRTDGASDADAADVRKIRCEKERQEEEKWKELLLIAFIRTFSLYVQAPVDALVHLEIESTRCSRLYGAAHADSEHGGGDHTHIYIRVFLFTSQLIVAALCIEYSAMFDIREFRE